MGPRKRRACAETMELRTIGKLVAPFRAPIAEWQRRIAFASTRLEAGRSTAEDRSRALQELAAVYEEAEDEHHRFLDAVQAHTGHTTVQVVDTAFSSLFSRIEKLLNEEKATPSGGRLALAEALHVDHPNPISDLGPKSQDRHRQRRLWPPGPAQFRSRPSQ